LDKLGDVQVECCDADDRTFHFSFVTRVDLTPLIHCWGIHPVKPAYLNKKLFMSEKMTLLLERYLTIILRKRGRIWGISAPVTKKTLFKLFLRKLLDPEIIKECEEFGFTGVPKNIRTMALTGIDSLDASGGAAWIYKTEADTPLGQGLHVISKKQYDYAEYARNGSQGYIELLQGTVFTAATVQSKHPIEAVHTGESARSAQAALVLSIIFMVVGFALVIVVHIKLKLRERESNHKNTET